MSLRCRQAQMDEDVGCSHKVDYVFKQKIKFHNLKGLSTCQCCRRVGPGTQEKEPWAKIHQNRTQNCQKILASFKTGPGTF